MVPAFCRSVVIHAMPERSVKKRSRIDFISTAELAPAFAAFSGRAVFLNFVIVVSTHVWDGKRSSVVEYVYGFMLSWIGLKFI